MNEHSRRRFLKTATGTTLFALLPLGATAAARVQAHRTVSVALLDQRFESDSQEFQRQLQRAFVRKFPGGPALRIESIPLPVQKDPVKLAAALHASEFDLCLTIGEQATRAAAISFRSRPIIFQAIDDPVVDGIVAAAQSPDRNLTGFTSFSPTHLKRWEVLFEAFPDIERLAVLVDAQWRHRASVQADALGQGARGRRVEIVVLDALRPIVQQLRSIPLHRHLAIDVPHSPLASKDPFIIIDFINSIRVPSIYDGTHYVRWGGLASYEADPLPDIDTIIEYMALLLNDVPPRLIPVRYPSSFSLAFNLQTASASALTISKRILKRANVIVRLTQRPRRELPSS
ncbi:MAG: ABC transporter substrate binding protein [Betaproteobacteria bacterium]